MMEGNQDPRDEIVASLSPRDVPSRERCGSEPSPRMLHAIEQFNRGEYWEQHETLEEIWRAEPEASIRNLYKGIIQVGVGFYHLKRGNYRGVMKVLARGINYLRPYSPECYGIDVARLIAAATTVYLRALELGPERLNEMQTDALPQVRLVREKNDRS